MPLELEDLLRDRGVSLIDFQNTLKWQPSDFRGGESQVHADLHEGDH
jgi:hypothetical protein